MDIKIKELFFFSMKLSCSSIRFTLRPFLAQVKSSTPAPSEISNTV